MFSIPLSLDTYQTDKYINLPHRPKMISLDAASETAVILAGEASGEGKQNRVLVVNIRKGLVRAETRLEREANTISFHAQRNIALAGSNREITLIDTITGEVVSIIPINGGFGADINHSTETAVIADKNGFTLLDLNAMELSAFTLPSKPDSVTVDRYRNTAIFGTPDGAIEVQLPNPAPRISSVVPSSARPGGSLRLRITGERFITSSEVDFGAYTLDTLYKENTLLNALLPGSLINAPGLYSVVVSTPPPGGGVSEPFIFTVKNPIPAFSSISPNTAVAKSSGIIIKAYGSNFSDGSTINFGGTDLSTSYVNTGELRAELPSSLIQTSGEVLVSVVSGDRYSSNFLKFTVMDPSPVITGFTPFEGQRGTVVNISGNHFDDISGVYFNGIKAIVVDMTGSEIKAVVPAGATTGHITVTNAHGNGQSSLPFTVHELENYELLVSPSSLSIPQGGSASALIILKTIGEKPFSGSDALALYNAPSGMEYSFLPGYISASRASQLTINLTSLTAPSDVVIETSGGKAATITINPIASGTTTLSGRILATKDSNPITGATITLGAFSVRSDAAGNFLFIDPPIGEQVLMLDGHTANTADSSYPSAIPVPVLIEGGKVNSLPYPVYLHEVNTKHYTNINPSLDTIVTDPDIPNFEMTIPAGVQIIGWDGIPNEKVSVTPVPVDRLPIPAPPDGVYANDIYMYYFFKPGGGIPTQPIQVKTPNLISGLPGERVMLWYYDESPVPDPNSNQWKPFGPGTISDDGRQIIPDEGVGIPKFCCGASFYETARIQDNFNSPPCPDCCGGLGPGTAGGLGGGPGGEPGGSGGGMGGAPHYPYGQPSPGVADPVDIYTGAYFYSNLDIGYPISSKVNVFREYNSANRRVGPFGRGTSINFNHVLEVVRDTLVLIPPEGGRYILSKGSDGYYINQTQPFLTGVKAFVESDNTKWIRFKDGTYYLFDSTGRLIEERDPNGNWLKITRDFLGNIDIVYDSFGRSLKFANIRISVNEGPTRVPMYIVVSSITDNLGRTVTYGYDNKAKLTSVTLPDGSAILYSYDGDGYSFQANGRVNSVTNPNGVISLENIYDSSGRVIEQTMADGGKYRINYRATNGIITETTVTNPNGLATTYRMNNMGYLTETINSFGQKAVSDRAFGTNELKSRSDSLGRKTEYLHDENYNRTSSKDPAGNVTSFEYDPIINEPIKITDALGNSTEMTYDSSGNIISVTDSLGQTSYVSYTREGRPSSLTDALGNNYKFEYDGYGNMIRSSDSLGNSTRMEYDIAGRLLKTIDSQGNETSYAYDAMNRVTEIEGKSGEITAFSYDYLGNLLTLTDAKEQTVAYKYSEMGRASSLTDQLGRTETYTYDLNGNLSTVTDRKGEVTFYTYDELDRLVRVDYADGTHTTREYDAGGRLAYVNDSVSGPIEFVYSDVGCAQGCGGVDKVISEITPIGAINYTYDALGKRTSMTVAGQETVYYAYDANGRLTSLTRGAKVWTFAYDAIGRRISATAPNGVVTTYSYDAGSNLLNMNHVNSLNQFIEKLTYAYDPNGNRTSMDRVSAGVQFPSPASNISYNSANQMLTFNEESLSYDANGNLVQKGATAYTWNARNQLAGINGPDMQASFKYDALGRRVEKTINGKTTQYLYDGLDIIQEIENGMVSANYIRTLNIDEPLVRTDDDGDYYYMQDGLGSVIGLADASGHEVVQYYYDPYGNTTTNNPEFRNPFQYTGRENDGTGCYYYRARYYCPELQRFISEDPIGFEGGINKYVYVHNRPTMFVDPLGLFDDPSGSGTPVPASPPAPSEYPLNPANWQPNPNGLVCSAVCGLGRGLMCYSIGMGTGGSGGIICTAVTTPACSAICPPPIQSKTCPKE